MEPERCADGLISKGTVIVVRGFVNGKTIVTLETEIDKRVSELVAEIRETCIAEMNIPRTCLRLVWKPPVLLQNEEALPAGFQGPLPRKHALMMEVSAAAQPPSLADLNRVEALDSDKFEYCLVCFDPAANADDLGWDRNILCVRCRPTTLCEKCKVIVGGEAVCLQCLKKSEECLLDAAQLVRRKLLMMFWNSENDPVP